MKPTNPLGRRSFLSRTAALASGLFAFNALPAEATPSPAAGESLYVIGPMEGVSPHIGTLISMLNYNRMTVIQAVQSLNKEQLDYLHDPQANTIGALLLHLGATDKYYQVNTFEGRQEFNDAEKKLWDVPMNLGEEGRKQIKGNNVKYYLDRINEVREKTIEELKKRDDKWLLAVDPAWSTQQSLNTYWKWFHVCEHESNHRGQISWLKSRLPGAKPGRD